jgi:putative spermidine/putrescine transport system permease protein
MTQMERGLTGEPPVLPLFSNYAVVLTCVPLYTLFIMVAIFNSTMRIDRSLLEAARDAGKAA